MKNTTTIKPSVIYIEKVENLYMDETEQATITNVYIEKVENLHMGKVRPTIPSYSKKVTDYHEPSYTSPLTNSQLVLACYYVLISWGIQPRVNLDIAQVARFIHLVTSKPYTQIKNSEFYKKLQKAPELKSTKELVKDLQLIKILLGELELAEASLLVDKELTLARQKINKRL
ncbi:MAG: hypothetical protein ACYC2U_03280 [Candidatus Amoebophilus sp.]